ncbi:hypothetical protein ANN_06846 [Periplaneta americana]|uniref:Transposable element P transposase-like GTP-binding insertion domain-containing protein n=1 Tax=Periplaneta americana TaxID=6978 RepID=A0ABQ8TFD8_PERAM|nr:hypothetical protein ANN_06846 [Periplaneta americana]
MENNFKRHDLSYKDEVYKWQLYNKDKDMNPRLCPNLRQKHIELPSFSPMRVCLAAQVLSHSVSKAIKTHVSFQSLPEEALQTAEFIELVDRGFDYFNSSTTNDAKSSRRALQATTCHWTTLQKLEKKGNCEIEVSEFLVTKKEISSFRICSDYPATENSFVETAELEEDSHDQCMIPDNALTYVTGWACSRIPHETCKLELASFKSENLTGIYQHIANKKYDSANFLIPTRLPFERTAERISEVVFNYLEEFNCSKKLIAQTYHGALVNRALGHGCAPRSGKMQQIKKGPCFVGIVAPRSHQGLSSFGVTLRNSRHYKIRSVIATFLKSNGYITYEEVHGIADTGSNRRIDIIIFKPGETKGYILDPTIRFEMHQNQPEEVNREKRTIYEPTIPYYKTLCKLRDIEVIGLMVGARGTIIKQFVSFCHKFGVPTTNKKIYMIALKGSLQILR